MTEHFITNNEQSWQVRGPAVEIEDDGDGSTWLDEFDLRNMLREIERANPRCMHGTEGCRKQTNHSLRTCM